MIQFRKTDKVNQANVTQVLSDLIRSYRELLSYQSPVPLKDGSTITWNVIGGYNAYVTLAGSRTLVLAGLTAGDYGTLKITQGGSGSYTLTLPSGSKVANGGSGALTLSTAVGAIDIATFYYDGTNIFWNLSTNFT